MSKIAECSGQMTCPGSIVPQESIAPWCGQKFSSVPMRSPSQKTAISHPRYFGCSISMASTPFACSSLSGQR